MDSPDADRRFKEDNDSLYRMPMAIVPVETVELRRGRMIKNAALDPAIELFRNAESGSGQLLVRDIDSERGHHMFGWPMDAEHPDLKLIRKLGRLTSYDVYSLRIQFRDLGIEPSSVEYLQLSEEKKEALRLYMHIFTLPLINLVYGEGSTAAQSTDDVVGLFRNPDTRIAHQNLTRLANALDVQISEIPKFLEDFSDIYLSLAYFQEYVDDLTPKIIDMLEELKALESNWQLAKDAHVMAMVRQIEGDLNDLLTSVTGRFEAFRQHSDRMWENITAAKFRMVKEHVISSQQTVGGVLCGLGIKLNAWKSRFPKKHAGGPIARAEMLFQEILPGLDKLQAIEREGRERSVAAERRAEEMNAA
jgi:hypothetical protein